VDGPVTAGRRGGQNRRTGSGGRDRRWGPEKMTCRDTSMGPTRTTERPDLSAQGVFKIG
jgi:hypothetical protein